MNVSKDNLSKAERKLQKQNRKTEKALNKIKKESQKTKTVYENNAEPVVTILCVRFGTKYGISYVEKLRNMVSRNITVPYEFVCLTDDPKPISGVRLIVQKPAGYTKGWWHKVHMFDPELPLKGRILYFDLDVIVFNNIDKLAITGKDQFLGIKDFNRKFYPTWKRLNSSVMAWNHGEQSHIFKQFKENPKVAMRLHGDQDWIWKTSNSKLTFFPDEWIQSYKWEIRSKQELHVHNGKRKFVKVRNDINPLPGCSVAVFHGEPNPEDVQDQFVVDNWK